MSTSSTVAQRAHLADFLKARRKELDLKPAAVARRCDRPPPWYRDIETGARVTLRLEEIEQLAKALRVDEGELMLRAREAGY